MCKSNQSLLSALCIGFVVVSIFVVAEKAKAHGEDKLGPHGGFIRMPGAFHTEVVPRENSIDIFLLDINWKNPSVKNSSVKVSLENDGAKRDLLCNARKEFFSCTLPKGAELKKGSFHLKAIRENASGAEMTYSLPLSVLKHSGH